MESVDVEYIGERQRNMVGAFGKAGAGGTSEY